MSENQPEVVTEQGESKKQSKKDAKKAEKAAKKAEQKANAQENRDPANNEGAHVLYINVILIVHSNLDYILFSIVIL